MRNGFIWSLALTAALFSSGAKAQSSSGATLTYTISIKGYNEVFMRGMVPGGKGLTGSEFFLRQSAEVSGKANISVSGGLLDNLSGNKTGNFDFSWLKNGNFADTIPATHERGGVRIGIVGDAQTKQWTKLRRLSNYNAASGKVLAYKELWSVDLQPSTANELAFNKSQGWLNYTINPNELDAIRAGFEKNVQQATLKSLKLQVETSCHNLCTIEVASTSSTGLDGSQPVTLSYYPNPIKKLTPTILMQIPDHTITVNFTVRLRNNQDEATDQSGGAQ